MPHRCLRILLLAHSFNSLTQRLFIELREAGHTVSVELDIADSVTEEAVALFQPDLLLAPFLKRRIPESVWSRHVCLVVHPGIPGDRGPSALDRAVLRGEREWGVTVLQADGEFDAGPVWASTSFPMRDAAKGSLYRREVTAAAVQAVFAALARFEPGAAGPDSHSTKSADSPIPFGLSLSKPCGNDRAPALRQAQGEREEGCPATASDPYDAAPPRRGQAWPLLRQAERAIDWTRDDTATVLRKIRSADGMPGLADTLFGVPCHLFDAHPATPDTVARAAAGQPGEVVARRHEAVLRRTVDGAVWIGHVRRGDVAPERAIKLPAALAFAAESAALPALEVPLRRDAAEWDELHYSEFGPAGARVGLLCFGFYNGAMSTPRCRRLSDALRAARERDTQVLLLAGGEDTFSNGIDLNSIEAAAHGLHDSAADASMRNIEAMDDVALEILQTTDRLTVSLLRGNAGAGGVFLALAADEVWAHAGVVLNPHYKNMGNLYGSEYWTYLLPRRVGAEGAQRISAARLPMGIAEAQHLGLVDACLGQDPDDALELAVQRALTLAKDNVGARVAAKQCRRAADEAQKPLSAYRREELARMHRNFYGFDPSYHVARHHFVHKLPQAWTPRHLAGHRELAPRAPR
jgi:putative two-component system hydrogenase maturation factor HypX/HoxX